MTLTKQEVREVIDVYIKAWETQDPDLIVTIFAEGATYHERVLGEPIPDRKAIRQYWQSKVVEAQANITCRLLNLYLDGDTAIAEWEAEFDDMAQGLRKRMREIAVLAFEGRRIASLREYWASEQTGPAMSLSGGTQAPNSGGRPVARAAGAGHSRSLSQKIMLGRPGPAA